MSVSSPPLPSSGPPRWIGRLLWGVALLWIAMCLSVAYGGALLGPGTFLLYVAGFYSLSVRTSPPASSVPAAGWEYLAAALALVVALSYAATEPDWYMLWCAGAMSVLVLLLSHWPGTNQTGRAALVVITLLVLAGPGYCLHYTRLHQSIRAGNAGHVVLLLRFGADANQPDQRQLPLAVAIEANRPDIMELLLEAGADPNARENRFENPSPLLIGAARSSDSMPLQILLNHGADPNLANGHGETALFHAARWGQHYNVKFLLDAGASTNVRNKRGQRPLDAARDWDNKGDIVRLLQRADTAASRQ